MYVAIVTGLNSFVVCNVLFMNKKTILIMKLLIEFNEMYRSYFLYSQYFINTGIYNDASLFVAFPRF